MQLASSAFAPNASIPSEFTCDGGNYNPPLDFLDVPAAAKSLVLIMEDPDVPTHLRADGMFDHWVLWNIPPETRHIAAGEAPLGEMGVTTRGVSGYTGPCPPDREHRYFFKLFALSEKLDLPTGSTKAEVLAAAEQYIIIDAQLMGKYNRQR